MAKRMRHEEDKKSASSAGISVRVAPAVVGPENEQGREPIVLAFYNFKGGVGKTTTAATLAWGLARTSRVIVVDLDPQCNMSQFFLSHQPHVWSDLIEDGEDTTGGGGGTTFVTVRDLTQNLLSGFTRSTSMLQLHPSPPSARAQQNSGDSGFELYLVPGHFDLTLFEQQLHQLYYEQHDANTVCALPHNIRELGVRTGADFIIIDLGPAASLFNRIMMLSSDGYFVPCQAGCPFSIHAVRQISRQIETWTEFHVDSLRSDAITSMATRFFLPHVVEDPKVEDPKVARLGRFLGCIVSRAEIPSGEGKTAPDRKAIMSLHNAGVELKRLAGYPLAALEQAHAERMRAAFPQYQFDPPLPLCFGTIFPLFPSGSKKKSVIPGVPIAFRSLKGLEIHHNAARLLTELVLSIFPDRTRT